MKKIVQGQFDLFPSRYKPFLEEYEAKEMMRFTWSEVAKQIFLWPFPSVHSVRSQVGGKMKSKVFFREKGEEREARENNKIVLADATVIHIYIYIKDCYSNDLKYK